MADNTNANRDNADQYQNPDAVDKQNNAPDLFALSLEVDDVDDLDMGTLYKLTNEHETFSLKRPEDYWKVEAIKEGVFGGDKEAFDKAYEKATYMHGTVDAVQSDLRQMMNIESPDNAVIPTPVQDLLVAGITLNSYMDSARVNKDNQAVGVTGTRGRKLTRKRIAQNLGVKTKDGYVDSPGILDLFSTDDIFRVARDEEGNPKMTLTGTPYIERVDGSEDIKTYDQVLGVLNTGIFKDSMFDGNQMEQSTGAQIGRQVHKFMPYLRVGIFAMNALSGAAEMVKSISDVVYGDEDNSVHKAMNRFQSIRSRFGMDQDEKSKESLWTIGGAAAAIGDIGPQILGMAAVAKLPSTIMSLKSSHAAGNRGLKLLKNATKAWEEHGTKSQKIIAQRIGSALSRGGMSLMATEDFAKEAKESGLSPKEALVMHTAFMGFMHFGPSKLTERISKPIEEKYEKALGMKVFKAFFKSLTNNGSKKLTEEQLKGAGAKLAQIYKKSLTKVKGIYASAGEAGVKGYLGSGVSEFTEEVLELSGETGLKWMFNETWARNEKAGLGRFHDIDWGSFAEEALFSGLMGFAGGTIGHFAHGSRKAANKVIDLTPENITEYMSHAIYDDEKRNAIESALNSGKAGLFASANLSYAKDKNGKFLPVNPESSNPLERTSQDEVIKESFISMWDAMKQTANRQVEIFQRTKGNEGKEWNKNIIEAYGNEVAAHYSPAHEEMAKHVSVIAKTKAELAKLEETEMKGEKDFTKSEKKEITEDKKALEEKIKKAEEEVQGIMEGKVANEYFEKSMFQLDPNINKDAEGNPITADDNNYIAFEDWKKMKLHLFDSAKKMIEEDDEIQKRGDDILKQLSEASSFNDIQRILRDVDAPLSVEVIQEMRELVNSNPELVTQIKQSILKDLQEYLDDGTLSLDQFELISGKVNDANNVNKLLSISENITFGEDEDKEEYTFSVDFEKSVKNAGGDQYVKRLGDISELLKLQREEDAYIINNIKAHESPFDPENIDTSTLETKLNEAQTEDDIFKILNEEQEENGIVRISSIDAVKSHIESILKDTKNDEGEVTENKNKKLARISRVLNMYTSRDKYTQALLKALDSNPNAGGMSFTGMIRQENEAYAEDPGKYNTELDYLRGIAEEISNKVKLINSILSIDLMNAKFQAINKHKFKFYREIENLLPEGARKILDKALKGDLSEEETKKLNEEFRKEMVKFQDGIDSFITKAHINTEHLRKLIEASEANSGNSLTGIQKKDMRMMDEDLEDLSTIIVDVFGVESDEFDELVNGKGENEGLLSLIERAKNSQTYKEKRELQKEAEIKFNITFTQQPDDRQAELANRLSIITTEEKTAYNYFRMVSRKSFAGIHAKFEKVEQKLKESGLTYEQERAAIQMATKFINEKDTHNLQVSRGVDKNYLENIGLTLGVGGSGKTTYVAPVISNIVAIANLISSDTDSAKVLISAPDKSQLDTLSSALDGKNIEIVEHNNYDQGNNYDIEQLTKDIDNKAEHLKGTTLIVIDESTLFTDEQFRTLDKVITKYNEEPLGAKLKVLAMGDPLQLGYYTVKDGMPTAKDISTISGVEKTKIIETSQRTGYIPNNVLLKRIRRRFEGGTEGMLDSSPVDLTYSIDSKQGDIGVRVMQKNSRGEFIKEAIKRKERADKLGQELVYISDRSDVELTDIINAGIEILPPEKVQGREYSQVIVDLNSEMMTLPTGHNRHDTLKVQARTLYTAISRGKSGVLIAESYGRNWNSKEGIVGKQESTMSPEMYDYFKKVKSDLTRSLVKLEEKYYGTESLITEEDGKTVPTKVNSLLSTDLTSHEQLYGDNLIMDAFRNYLQKKMDEGLYSDGESLVDHAQEFKKEMDKAFEELDTKMAAVSDPSERMETFNQDYENSEYLKYFDKSNLSEIFGLEIVPELPGIQKFPEVEDGLFTAVDKVQNQDKKNKILSLLEDYNELIKNTKC